MTVGTLEVHLFICESRSLKGRRSVVKSLKDRIRSRYNVSVSEVGDLEAWQRAVLGVAVVTNERRFANEILSKVVGLIGSDVRVEIVDQRMQFL